MKIAICDDNALCREQIWQIVSGYISRNKLDISLSVYERGIPLLEDAQRMGGFDIYILDILMPGLNGIQLGLQIRQQDLGGKILYLTSSPEYAVEAFKAQASGYVLKPVREEEFLSVLGDMIQSVYSKKAKSLIIKSRESVIRIPYDSLLYAELVKKTIVYHLVSGKQVESMSIRSTFSEATAELLQDKRFALCGNNKVVNLHYVSELDADQLIFRSGQSLYIGRRAGRDLKSVWFDFWFNGEDSL